MAHSNRTLPLVAVGLAASLVVAYVVIRPQPRAAPSGLHAAASSTSTAAGEPPQAERGAATGPNTGTHGASAVASTDAPALPAYRGPIRDAAQAALVREALIARKANELSAPTSAAKMPEPVGTGNQADKPLGEYVKRVMQEQFVPLAAQCYESLLAAKPDAQGDVALEFSILGDPSVGGVVVDVTLGDGTTLRDNEFRSCVTESMYAVIFEAPPGEEGSVSVKQSFSLAP